MWSSVSVLIPPAADLLPISVEQMAYRLKLITSVEDDIDEGEQADLADFIAAGVALIDGPDGIGYAMMTQTWALTLDHFPPVVILPGAPIRSVSAIKYIDADLIEQTLDSADYHVDFHCGRLRVRPALGKSWPQTYAYGAVIFEYVLGVDDNADCDKGLVSAVSLYAGHLYANREAVVTGAISSELPLGVQSQLARMSRIPAAF